MKNYHCCATCQHYEVRKMAGKPALYRCSRLGFETKPTYQFNCWNPKEKVKELMEKDRRKVRKLE